ncbi:unnamed protein product [Pleuronectes platessa]|uniref:Uncharacterized protein n=1 Tax=Pleuronectes platessa TaxID=8262 RepID=A0A9N7UQF9_PLEPL|nr:unnamed protein product [Pleuronectes platessa]
MSKCLFMPNWATDEPAATAVYPEGRRRMEVLQRRDEERRWFKNKNKQRKQGGGEASEGARGEYQGWRRRKKQFEELRISAGTSGGKVISSNYTTRLVQHVWPHDKSCQSAPPLSTFKSTHCISLEQHTGTSVPTELASRAHRGAGVVHEQT